MVIEWDQDICLQSILSFFSGMIAYKVQPETTQCFLVRDASGSLSGLLGSQTLQNAS